jgi:hypothetical protein
MMAVRLNDAQRELLERNPTLDPRFIPKDWNGGADLDDKYHRAEQAFLAQQQIKKALEAKPTEPKPKRKASKSADAHLFEVMGKAVGNALQPINERLKALEAKPVMEFQGLWKPKQPYRKGSVVVHDGSSWVAKEGGTGHRPGTDDGAKQWALAAKRGRDAR